MRREIFTAKNGAQTIKERKNIQIAVLKFKKFNVAEVDTKQRELKEGSESINAFIRPVNTQKCYKIKCGIIYSVEGLPINL